MKKHLLTYSIFILLIVVTSCSSDKLEPSKTEIDSTIKEKKISLKPFVEYDTLNRVLAEGFVNDKELFEGELTLYTHDLGILEKLNMHNDTIIIISR